MDEFELIRRCFLDRAVRRPGTVLGIGDDAALLDTGGLPLVHARATVAFSNRDDAAGTACRVFGAAFIRLAAQAAAPRWATLGLTSEAGDPDWIEPFSAAAAETCDACRVELIGGDTTRGPGRATVFALGTERALSRGTVPRPPAVTTEARWTLAMASATVGAAMGTTMDVTASSTASTTMGATVDAIAELVSVCVDLAAQGAVIRCDDMPGTSDDARTGLLELVAHADAAGMDALDAAAGRLRPSGSISPSRNTSNHRSSPGRPD